MKTAKEISAIFIEHNEQGRNSRSTARCRKFILFLGLALMIAAIPILITEQIIENEPSKNKIFNAATQLIPVGLGCLLLIGGFLIFEHTNVENCLRPINARMFKLYHKAFPDPKEEGYKHLPPEL